MVYGTGARAEMVWVELTCFRVKKKEVTKYKMATICRAIPSAASAVFRRTAFGQANLKCMLFVIGLLDIIIRCYKTASCYLSFKTPDGIRNQTQNFGGVEFGNFAALNDWKIIYF